MEENVVGGLRQFEEQVALFLYMAVFCHSLLMLVRRLFTRTFVANRESSM